MAVSFKDRLNALLAPANATLNGIDFVEVDGGDERILRVHFLNKVLLSGNPTEAAITGGETIATVAVPPITAANNWKSDSAGRPLLVLTLPASGDFSLYTLTLAKNEAIDPFFRATRFSFKANCPSDLDCQPVARPCPPLPGDAPPIDYLAKDFLSFRRALSDFSALRYPEWRERSEADFGVMFLEALSSLADDLSYTQDRIAAEAALDTATQRRSLVRLARLVDYEPTPAVSARVWLQLDVAGGTVPPGLALTAPAPDGGTLVFETGNGLIDPQTGKPDTAVFAINPGWNRGLLKPYIWDESQSCLPAGATEMWIEGHGHNFARPQGTTQGTALLIDTPAVTPADPPVRQIVHLTDFQEEADALFPGLPAPPAPVTHLFWDASEALQQDHPLFWTPQQILVFGGDPRRTMLAGNIVPATHGQRMTETFAINAPPATAPLTPLALARTGPNDRPDAPAIQYLHTLNATPLAWLLRDDPTNPLAQTPLPEIALAQTDLAAPPDWNWLRSLLKAELFANVFTVDPARYRRIRQNADSSLMSDYDDDQGATIRFGDGVFGEVPADGAVFSVTYRVGSGAVGNVARDTITGLSIPARAFILAATNPFPATGGADAETDAQIRRNAPQAFRALQYRAVLAKDYEQAAQRLPWVEKAGTTFRWTGSWLTVFTAADPKGTETIPTDAHIQLIDLLNRYRMAGYESYVPPPRYIGLDLIVTVCARPDAFRGDVESALHATLSAAQNPDGTTGFFFLDRFTFGTPLEFSALEAAIQNSYGVAGVLSITYRERGRTSGYQSLPDTLTVGTNEILRVDNDASRPDRGSLNLIVEGGK